MKKGLFLFFLLSLTFHLKAQVITQTGESAHAMPLLSYSDEGNRLSASVGLSYRSSGGIKANSIASCVGTGWDLNVGGFISRTTVGQPDDQKYVHLPAATDYFTTNPKLNANQLPPAYAYFPDGFLFTNYTANDDLYQYSIYAPIANGLTHLYSKAKYDVDDREQDIFTFSFNGRSGSFVIGKDWNVYPIQDCKLKFTITQADMSGDGVRTRIESFKIKDETGIEYFFNKREYTEVWHYERFGTPLYPQEITIAGEGIAYKPKDHHVIYKVTSKWFLTSMKNPFSGAEIIYNYDDEYYDYRGPKHVSRTEIYPGRYQFMFEKVKVQSCRLKEVVLNTNEKFVFSYMSQQRADLPGGFALQSVSHRIGANDVKKYELELKYFFNNELKDYNFTFSSENFWRARLALTKVSEIANDASKQNLKVFEYYLGDDYNVYSICPQFTLAHDAQGYYMHAYRIMEASDGTPQKMIYESFAGYPLPGISQHLGLLKKVGTPLDGFEQFYYEQHGAPVGGVRVSKYEVSDGETSIFTEYKYVNEDGTTSRWGDEAAVYNETKVYRKYKTSGNDIRVGTNSLEFLSSFKDINKQSLTTTATSHTIHTIGSVIGGIIIGYVVGQIVDALIFEFSPNYQDQSITHRHVDDFRAANPLFTQYKRVEVHQKGGGSENLGRTIYEYTSPSDPGLALFVPVLSAPYSMKQRMAHWYYGLPQKVTVLNALNTKVSEQEYAYDFFSAEYQNENTKSAKYWSDMLILSPYASHYNYFGTTPISKEVYYPVHGRTELKELKSRTYGEAGGYQETITKYFYNAQNFQLARTEVEKGAGIVEGQNVYYTVDYSLPGILADMKNPNGYNMLNVPVAKSSWVKKGSGSAFLKGLTVNNYAIAPNADIKAMEVFTFNAQTPVTTSDFVTSLPSGSLSGYSYLKSTLNTSYNASGTPSTINSKGRLSGFYYSPVHKGVVIAEASNAKGNEIFYDSFEDDGTWDGVVMESTRMRQGRRSGRITNTNPNVLEETRHSNVWLNVSNAAPKKYKYSTWFYSDGPQVELFFFMRTTTETLYYTHVTSKVSNVTNKWTFLEGEFEVPANITKLNVRLDNNGVGNIWFDDVRIQPSDASMITYTYDPLIGKTSECDDLNMVQFYEYDKLGRLSIIRDKDRNVLKRICYSYSGQEEACKVYYNSAMSQAFTKNNCGPGYVGGSYSYVVPANTFAASSPQEANQLALNDINQNGQATANANTTCTQVFQSSDVTGYYFNQNCPSGTGIPIYVHMPAGSYTSTVSSTDATNIAIGAAQDYANMYGQCSNGFFTLTGSNASPTGVVVILTNPDTWQSQYFYLDAYTGYTSILGDIAPGYYHVELIPDVNWYNLTYNFGGYYGYFNSSTTLYSVYLDDYFNYINIF